MFTQLCLLITGAWGVSRFITDAENGTDKISRLERKSRKSYSRVERKINYGSTDWISILFYIDEYKLTSGLQYKLSLIHISSDVPHK